MVMKSNLESNSGAIQAKSIYWNNTIYLIGGTISASGDVAQLDPEIRRYNLNTTSKGTVSNICPNTTADCSKIGKQ